MSALLGPMVAEPLEPATQVFIDSLAGGTPIFTLSPQTPRDVVAGAQKSVSVTLAPASSEDRVLAVGPKGRTAIRVYRPADAKGALPVVIYTHGGHSYKPGRLFRIAARRLPQPGQTKPSGQRRLNKNATQLAS